MDVEVGQVRRLEDRLVDVPVLEQVLDQVCFRRLLEVLEGPDLVGWAEVAVVVVEAVDETLALAIGLVGGRRVPEVDVPVDDEVVLAILAVHARQPA